MSSMLITKYIQSPAMGSIVLLRHEKRIAVINSECHKYSTAVRRLKKAQKVPVISVRRSSQNTTKSSVPEKAQNQILSLLTSGSSAIALTAGPSFRAIRSDTDSSSYPQKIDKLSQVKY